MSATAFTTARPLDRSELESAPVRYPRPSALGERLALGGGSGPVVTGLWNAVPQVICLIIVGRLAAALILPEP